MKERFALQQEQPKFENSLFGTACQGIAVLLRAMHVKNKPKQASDPAGIEVPTVALMVSVFSFSCRCERSTRTLSKRVRCSKKGHETKRTSSETSLHLSTRDVVESHVVAGAIGVVPVLPAQPLPAHQRIHARLVLVVHSQQLVPRAPAHHPPIRLPLSAGSDLRDGDPWANSGPQWIYSMRRSHIYGGTSFFPFLANQR